MRAEPVARPHVPGNLSRLVGIAELGLPAAIVAEIAQRSRPSRADCGHLTRRARLCLQHRPVLLCGICAERHVRDVDHAAECIGCGTAGQLVMGVEASGVDLAAVVCEVCAEDADMWRDRAFWAGLHLTLTTTAGGAL